MVGSGVVTVRVVRGQLEASWWSGTHATCGWCRRSCVFVDWPSVGNLFPFNFLSVFLTTLSYHRILPLSIPSLHPPSPSPLSIPTFICHRGLVLPYEPTFKTAKVTSY